MEGGALPPPDDQADVRYPSCRWRDRLRSHGSYEGNALSLDSRSSEETRMALHDGSAAGSKRNYGCVAPRRLVKASKRAAFVPTATEKAASPAADDAHSASGFLPKHPEDEPDQGASSECELEGYLAACQLSTIGLATSTTTGARRALAASACAHTSPRAPLEEQATKAATSAAPCGKDGDAPSSGWFQYEGQPWWACSDGALASAMAQLSAEGSAHVQRKPLTSPDADAKTLATACECGGLALGDRERVPEREQAMSSPTVLATPRRTLDVDSALHATNLGLGVLAIGPGKSPPRAPGRGDTSAIASQRSQIRRGRERRSHEGDRSPREAQLLAGATMGESLPIPTISAPGRKPEGKVLSAPTSRLTKAEAPLKKKDGHIAHEAAALGPCRPTTSTAAAPSTSRGRASPPSPAPCASASASHSWSAQESAGRIKRPRVDTATYTPASHRPPCVVGGPSPPPGQEGVLATAAEPSPHRHLTTTHSTDPVPRRECTVGAAPLLSLPLEILGHVAGCLGKLTDLARCALAPWPPHGRHAPCSAPLPLATCHAPARRMALACRTLREACADDLAWAPVVLRLCEHFSERRPLCPGCDPFDFVEHPGLECRSLCARAVVWPPEAARLTRAALPIHAGASSSPGAPTTRPSMATAWRWNRPRSSTRMRRTPRTCAPPCATARSFPCGFAGPTRAGPTQRHASAWPCSSIGAEARDVLPCPSLTPSPTPTAVAVRGPRWPPPAPRVSSWSCSARRTPPPTGPWRPTCPYAASPSACTYAVNSSRARAPPPATLHGQCPLHATRGLARR